MTKSTPPTSSASKEQAPEKPKRFCSRCGRELFYSEGLSRRPKYDTQTGKLLEIEYLLICPASETLGESYHDVDSFIVSGGIPPKDYIEYKREMEQAISDIENPTNLMTVFVQALLLFFGVILIVLAFIWVYNHA